MSSRFSFSLAGAALVTGTLVLGTFAVAQAKPKSNPGSRPVAATGIVVGAPGATDFQLRTATGLLRVRFHGKVNIKEIRGGDQVRVFGRPLGRVLYDSNVRLLRAKASNNPDDYSRPTVERLNGKPRRGSQERSGN